MLLICKITHDLICGDDTNLFVIIIILLVVIERLTEHVFMKTGEQFFLLNIRGNGILF